MPYVSQQCAFHQETEVSEGYFCPACKTKHAAIMPALQEWVAYWQAPDNRKPKLSAEANDLPAWMCEMIRSEHERRTDERRWMEHIDDPTQDELSTRVDNPEKDSNVGMSIFIEETMPGDSRPLRSHITDPYSFKELLDAAIGTEVDQTTGERLTDLNQPYYDKLLRLLDAGYIDFLDLLILYNEYGDRAMYERSGHSLPRDDNKRKLRILNNFLRQLAQTSPGLEAWGIKPLRSVNKYREKRRIARLKLEAHPEL